MAHSFPQFILTCIVYAELFCLAVLTLFGAHRLYLVLCYFRLRRHQPRPLRPFHRLPRVTIQIPIFNERHVATRCIEAIADIEYPREMLEVQVLDDSSDPLSRRLAAEAVEKLRAKGIISSLLHRSHRSGYKAGALQAGLEHSFGEFIAIFDADFIPSADFLSSTIHYFTDATIDMVQCRWSHLNDSASLLTRAQAALLDGHFQIEHCVRNRLGDFFNFNGTAGIWRKSAIGAAGGWQGDTLTEDLDLSYRAQLRGSRFIYLVDDAIPAELPNSLAGLKSQQHRWTKGAIEVFFKLFPDIIKSSIPLTTKLQAFFHLASNFCYPLLLLAGMLLLPALYSATTSFEPSAPELALARVLFLLGFCSVALFYFVALSESRQLSIWRRIQDTLLALIAGIALSPSNSRAVLEAILGHKSAFIRTPKTGQIQAMQKLQSTASHFNTGKPRTQRRSSRAAGHEVALALYFLCTLYLALRLGLYEALPFTSLFCAGFLWFTGISLSHSLSRLRVSRRQRLSSYSA